MSVEVYVPQWGMGIKECKVVSWFKAEGDAVEEGEPIAELETAKATQELEAPVSGTLSRIVVPEGETVAVRTLLAEIIEMAEATA